MYDFTKNEMEIIKDNLMSFVANFGKPRIERGDDGESFYVFTDNSDSWRQYCYNIDYLNGWLYGCTQAACGNPKRDEEMREMCDSASFRERYAVLHGERETKIINGHKCYAFTYSDDDEYQDANGALYDTVEKRWRDYKAKRYFESREHRELFDGELKVCQIPSMICVLDE